MASLIPPGYLSRHFTRILQPPFHLDTSDAIPLGRHPIFFGCLTAAIPPDRHPIFFGCLTTAIPPGYLSRHSTRTPQPSFHPTDIPFSLDVSQPPFHLDTSAAIPPGYLNRHSTRMPQPPFHPADIPFSLDVSQPPFYPTDVPPSPDISHPAPDAGWERRTIQLPIELTNQDVFLS
uniref:Uncharacterized protein n=1 Tax=Vitis vinifera TaxID=29760 RepID=A5BKT7_VITVI|nr:hypothetical protein VITISV_006956 [Vitis vinifera]